MGVERILLELHPPVAYSWWWWLVVVGLVLAAAALLGVGIRRWRQLRREVAPVPVPGLDELRRTTLAELAQTAARVDLCEEERVRRLGRAVRRFAGIALDGDADYLSSEQLRVAALADPRLIPVADLAAQVDPLAFGSANDDDVARIAAAAQGVVRRWR